MHKKLRFIAATLFVPALALSQAHANSIVNGDFESGSLDGWTTYTTTNGRLVAGNESLSFDNFDVDGDGNSSLAPQFRVGQITYADGVQAGGGIEQSFATAAGALSLSLDVAAYLDPASTETANSFGGLFQVFIDGTLATSFDAASINNGQTISQHLTFDEIVNAGVHDLKIQITRPSLNSNHFNAVTGSSMTPVQFVDDIVVDAPAPVPEPSTTLMMTLGLAMLGLIGKRRSY